MVGRVVAELLSAVPPHTGLMLVLALAISALGFRRVVWFVSLGYAGSVALIAVVGAALFHASLTAGSALHAALLLAYGVRLGGYLLRRELSPAYAAGREDAQRRGGAVRPVLKPLIWVSVSLLYVLMTLPLLLALSHPPAHPWLFQGPGLGIAAAGLGLEALADHQKSLYKASHPRHWCDVGLYRWVRCPNYLGEMVFWTGSFVAGLGAVHHWLQALAAAVGLICLLLIMMGSTKRLEAEQGARYGQDEAYQRYTRTVPVLFPFVPVYTLKGVRVYLE